MTAAQGVDDSAGVPESSRETTSERRFLRSRTNRALAGICGGIAEYYGSDVNAVRILAVLIAILTGIVPMLIVYLVAAIVIPERLEDGSAPASAAGADSPARGAGLIFGFMLIAVGALALANELFRVDWDVLWPVALVALGFVLLVGARRP